MRLGRVSFALLTRLLDLDLSGSQVDPLSPGQAAVVDAEARAQAQAQVQAQALAQAQVAEGNGSAVNDQAAREGAVVAPAGPGPLSSLRQIVFTATTRLPAAFPSPHFN